jgi:hypothetical protein
MDSSINESWTSPFQKCSGFRVEVCSYERKIILGVYTGLAVLTVTPIAAQARKMIGYSGQLLENTNATSPFL